MALIDNYKILKKSSVDVVILELQQEDDQNGWVSIATAQGKNENEAEKRLGDYVLFLDPLETFAGDRASLDAFLKIDK